MFLFAFLFSICFLCLLCFLSLTSEISPLCDIDSCESSLKPAEKNGDSGYQTKNIDKPSNRCSTVAFLRILLVTLLEEQKAWILNYSPSSWVKAADSAEKGSTKTLSARPKACGQKQKRWPTGKSNSKNDSKPRKNIC